MSTPIVYFGKNKEISDTIIAGLKPEYEGECTPRP
jgi:hypothetical protein